MKLAHWTGLVLLLLLAVGCQKPADSPAEKEYEVKGKVVAVDPDKKSVTLDHEDIPGLMKGMQMKFKVEDPKIAEGIAPGDQVQGRLRVKSGEHTITRLEKR